LHESHLRVGLPLIGNQKCAGGCIAPRVICGTKNFGKSTYNIDLIGAG
jgi:hypothetical protein